MSEQKTPVCDACDLPPLAAAGATKEELATGGLPPGWVRRKIGRRTFTLCDCCGSIHHFKGGISAYLQDALGVGPDAACDFTSEPGAGLHRLRLRPVSEKTTDDDASGGGRP